jgi:hypothetical protein
MPGTPSIYLYNEPAKALCPVCYRPAKFGSPFCLVCDDRIRDFACQECGRLLDREDIVNNREYCVACENVRCGECGGFFPDTGGPDGDVDLRCIEDRGLCFDCYVRSVD